MQGFWIKFIDGSRGYCEGQNAYDAARIAEHITGKTVDGGPNKYQPQLEVLPYPALPIIWQLDHPIIGKAPAFCYEPNKCCGKTSCPQRYSCTE